MSAVSHIFLIQYGSALHGQLWPLEHILEPRHQDLSLEQVSLLYQNVISVHPVSYLKQLLDKGAEISDLELPSLSPKIPTWCENEKD